MNAITSTILLIASVGALSSCGTFKPAARLTTQSEAEQSNSKGISFLNVKAVEHNKTVTRQQSTTIVNDALATTAKTVTKPKGAQIEDKGNYTALQLKYAEKLGVQPSEIKTTKLFEAIEEWYGTRYRFGGTTKRGVDCSSLMQHLYKQTYGLAIPRTAVTQHRATTRVSQEELQEGDLVFFHTTRAGISHVGLYIGNRKFVHASSSRGVVISSLDESYYIPRYRGAGRFVGNYKHDGTEEGTDEEMEGTK